MTKVKEIKTKNPKRKARITVKSLLLDVKKRVNKKQIEAVTKILEEKYEQLRAAKKVAKKIEAQIREFENKDIEEIDTEDYVYEEDE